MHPAAQPASPPPLLPISHSQHLQPTASPFSPVISPSIFSNSKKAANIPFLHCCGLALQSFGLYITKNLKFLKHTIIWQQSCKKNAVLWTDIRKIGKCCFSANSRISIHKSHLLAVAQYQSKYALRWSFRGYMTTIC